MEDNKELTITIPIAAYRDMLEIQIRSQQFFIGFEQLNKRIDGLEHIILSMNDRWNKQWHCLRYVDVER